MARSPSIATHVDIAADRFENGKEKGRRETDLRRHYGLATPMPMPLFGKKPGTNRTRAENRTENLNWLVLSAEVLIHC